MDNASSHPSTEQLCSRDGLIKTDSSRQYIATTSLIQPMYQGVLYNLKEGTKEFYLKR